jgi:hypothetical protein
VQTNADIQGLVQSGILTNYLDANRGRNNCSLRLSNAGKCKRQVALKASPAEERPLDYEAAAMFSHGTMRGEQMAAGFVTSATEAGMAVMLETEHWLEIPNPDSDDGWDQDFANKLEDVLSVMFGGKDLPVKIEPDGNEGRLIYVRGRSDAILIDTEGKVTVVECKTANPFSFKLTKEDPGKKIDAGYKAQLASYVVAFEEANQGIEMLDPVFLFENKGTHELFQHHVPVDEMRLLVESQVRPQYALLFKAIVKGKQRDVSPDYGPVKGNALPWQCNYCPVGMSCWKNAGVHDGAPGKRIPKLSVSSPGTWRDGEGSSSAGGGPRYEKSNIGKIPTEDIKPTY